MIRRIYDKHLNINGKIYTQVVIDPHYENKHSSTISDSIILSLVEVLNGSTFKPVDADEGFNYFVNDHLELKGNF